MGWLKITHEYKLHRKSNSRFLLKSSQTQAAGEMAHSILFEVLMKRLAAQKHSEWADGEAKYGLRGEICKLCLCVRVSEGCVWLHRVIIKHLRVLLLEILGCGSDMLFSPLCFCKLGHCVSTRNISFLGSALHQNFRGKSKKLTGSTQLLHRSIRSGLFVLNGALLSRICSCVQEALRSLRVALPRSQTSPAWTSLTMVR